MAFIQTLAAQLPAIDTRPISQIEQEIADELDFHITMRTEENMSQGMSPDTARVAALAQFGDFAAVQQKCRRALLGARIMWQRIQMVLSIVLLAAVVLLAVQLFNSQRANRAAIDDIASALKQLAPVPAGNAAPPASDKPASSTATAQATNSPENGAPPSVANLPAVVVKTEPQAGLTDVDPNIKEIRVTYSKKMMDGSWSWGQISNDTFPQTTGKPRYLEDSKTCVLPVNLEPGQTYVLQLNSLKGKFMNFKDADRQPAVPYLLVFETRQDNATK